MKMETTLETLLTTNQVARILNVHPHTVRGWAKDGTLPAKMLGKRRLRFEPSVVAVFGDQQDKK